MRDSSIRAESLTLEIIKEWSTREDPIHVLLDVGAWD